MSREERISYIKAIEKSFNTRLICYITGDRPGLETRIAPDILPIVYEFLMKKGHSERIHLFVYSMGGDSIAGWSLVNLVREFCGFFGVMVPFRAFSCGTLIALGANEIIMARGGQLSPIDPSLSSPYNPTAPGQQPGLGPNLTLLPVSVEDVMGYLDLVKEGAGIKGDEGLAKVVSILSEKVHPMALGAVFRSREQIKDLAKKLLSFHEKDIKKIDKIVNTLTEELHSHQYTLGRKESIEDIGLNITIPDQEQEDLIWNLYKQYESLLELRIQHNPEVVLGTEKSKVVKLIRGIVETLEADENLRTFSFITEKEIRKVQIHQPGSPVPLDLVQEKMIKQCWEQVDV